jgi:16S rRNA (cytosine1407-C5)-methyltransferase
MENRGTLYANESNLDRIKMLVHNLDRMNLVNLGVIKHRGEKLSKIFENLFTKVLVDAPCSALGILQKKNEVSGWWKLSQAEKLAELQYRLLVSAIKMAKVGAEIVYSTCTLTLEENELVVNKILKKYPVELTDVELPIKSVPGFTKYGDEALNPDLAKTHRIIPWENNSEGFFVCKFVKIAETEPMEKTEIAKKGISFVSHNHRSVKKYLENVSERFDISRGAFEEFQFLVKKNEIYFLTRDFEVENIDAFLRIGARFGKIDKRDVAHIHTLAAQILGKKAGKNVVELDTEDVKIYLQGGTVKKSWEPFGQKIVKYDGNIIGTGIAYADGLKSQFPRALRTHNIVFPK